MIKLNPNDVFLLGLGAGCIIVGVVLGIFLVNFFSLFL
jgi:hypothetical protein